MRIRGFTTSAVPAGVWAAACTALYAQPVIHEIHYDPPDRTQPAEFVELHNPSADPVSLAGWQLRGGVSFTFPAGATLPAAGYLVVAQNPDALRAAFGVSAFGPWIGRLRNEDERVELRDAEGGLVDRVDFQLGFPWPTVGTPPGNSIELVHPALDNDLGGNWRPSIAGGGGASARYRWVEAGESWRFFRGRAAPSSPESSWREPGFDAGSWETGRLPIGYDPSLSLRTPLDDMRNGYSTLYLRRPFVVEKADTDYSIELQALYDDGFKVWINGRFVLEANVAGGELRYDGVAASARESESFETFTASLPAGILVPGTNWIAVQVFNSSISASSDCYFDLRLDGVSGPTGQGPTPGRANRAFATVSPPAIRQVEHAPEAPRGGDAVRISAKVTDPEGVKSVALAYQVVEPGAYIELEDPAFETQWTETPMRDDGTGGDSIAGDAIYTATLPASLQKHRRLIRYRVTASDAASASVRVPYPDDPQPNFAYFVYDGVPAWTGAVKPGDRGTLGRVFTVDAAEMNRLPVLHLLAKRETVEQCTWFSRYGGDAYPWVGTLVFRGRVYDHIHYRARGGVWRYAMTKNMWKFDFNRGHDFEAVDDWGHPFPVRWSKLNLGASIQQGDFEHRGEQGMFESVGFRVFRLAGVPAMNSAFTQFRVIDSAAEAPADDQYSGDFWGVYLCLEQPDGRFLEQHGLPDGNLYKMEGGGGEANHVGAAGPADGSDLATFLREYTGATEDWWRTNFDVANYASYQTVVQAIHHYDICYDKNFFYYLNPRSGQWRVIPWDLDLTWADNMFDASCGGVDRIKQRLLPAVDRYPAVRRAWQNRIREFRDLFWNSDEAHRLIDEMAGRLRGLGEGPTILDADRAQWDYNPRMADPSYTSAGTSKAGQGRYYRWAPYPASVTRDFEGCLRLMKDYVGFRSTNASARARALDLLANDPSVPARPTLAAAHAEGFPVDALRFRCSAYQGASPFARMRWRIGEIEKPASPRASALADRPWKYEIEPVWDSGDLPSFEPEIAVPAGLLRVGAHYRARVRFEDADGRTSAWSAPVEFAATAPAATPGLTSNLRLTELMYNAPGGATNDFLELYNAGTTALNLGGLRFTEGIDFVIPTGTTLAPGGYLVVTKAPATGNFAAFRAYYGLGTDVRIVGPYSGNLSDAGEELTLSTAAGGKTVLHVNYSDGRGWPPAADGVGHSMVPVRDLGPDPGALDFSGNWRGSALLRGSPGRADPEPDTRVVLNEIVAHTDFLGEFDSNDWVELYNRTDAPIALGDGWYLSDTGSNLQRWRIPAGTVLPARGFLAFDENSGFNKPRGTGFSIDKAGETVFLSHFPAGSPGGVVDTIAFKSQENDWSIARVPDGGTYWDAVLPRTLAGPNAGPGARVVLAEILYNEGGIPTNTVDADALEFVELHNASAVPVDLFNPSGTWRLNGGAEYQFTQPITLGAGERILLVPWNPGLEPALLARFRQLFAIASNVRVFGPFLGRLDNDTDRIALERPQAPDTVGDPITWVIVDEVTYHDSTPWPGGADGTGRSYHRVSPLTPGNNPAAWIDAPPSPGSGIPTTTVDADGDTMPDAWETTHGLDPRDPSDGPKDADGDGLSNAAEFAAGTNPRDGESSLRITGIERTDSGPIRVRFRAVAGKTYRLEGSPSASAGSWATVQTVPAPAESGEVVLELPTTGTETSRFYRVRLP